MQPFKSILVDIDATVPAHPALDRAVRLARSCGAKLTSADVLTTPADARRSLRADVEEKLVSRHHQLRPDNQRGEAEHKPSERDHRDRT